jgi:site-specific DNA recombinase
MEEIIMKRDLLPENAKEKVIRVAIYVRVSTVYQIDKDSLPMMRQELVAYCKYILGTEDYVIFEDAGYSGKNTDRPDYQKMMRQIREGLFTHLLVWKIDRISRNLLDFANMYDELKDLGVTFISKNEQFDTSTAIGEAMLKIILVFAELERNMTSERVTATMINRASNGIWNGGRVPYGYTYDKPTQTFSICEEENKIYNIMVAKYEETESLVHTARALSDAGYRSREGNLWSPVSVWIILRNPWYKGVYRYNYYKIPGRKAIKDESEWVIVENHHPASIDPERFDRIQTTLSKNARFRNTPGRKTTGTNVHVFSGLLWCADCGAAFTASPGRLHVSGYRPTKYGCPNARKTKTCHAKFTSDVMLGEFLLNYILNMLNAQKHFSEIHSPEDLQKRLLLGSTFSDVERLDPDGLNALFNMLSQYSGNDTVLMKRSKAKVKVDPELRRLMSDQKKHQRALDRLNDLYLYSEDAMSEREYLVRKREITDALQEINETIGMISQESWARTMDDSDFIRQASTFILTQKLADKQYIFYEALAETTDPEVLKNFFLSILDSVILKDGRPQTIVFRNGLSHTFTYSEK